MGNKGGVVDMMKGKIQSDSRDFDTNMSRKDTKAKSSSKNIESKL